MFKNNLYLQFRDNEYVDDAQALAASLPITSDYEKRTSSFNNEMLNKISRSKNFGKKNLGIGNMNGGGRRRGILGNGLFGGGLRGRNSLGGLSSMRNALDIRNLDRNSLTSATLENLAATKQGIENLDLNPNVMSDNSFNSDDEPEIFMENKNLSETGSNPINNINSNGNRGRNSFGTLSRNRFGVNNLGGTRLGGRLFSSNIPLRGNLPNSRFDDDSSIRRMDKFKGEVIDDKNHDDQIVDDNISRDNLNGNRIGGTDLVSARFGNNRGTLFGAKNTGRQIDNSNNFSGSISQNDNVEENNANSKNIFVADPQVENSDVDNNFNSGGLVRSLSSGSLGRGGLGMGRSTLLGSRGRGRGLSLSIDASMKVLRQALLFKSAMLKQRQQLSRARENNKYLQTIGKRSVKEER